MLVIARILVFICVIVAGTFGLPVSSRISPEDEALEKNETQNYSRAHCPCLNAISKELPSNANYSSCSNWPNVCEPEVYYELSQAFIRPNCPDETGRRRLIRSPELSWDRGQCQRNCESKQWDTVINASFCKNDMSAHNLITGCYRIVLLNNEAEVTNYSNCFWIDTIQPQRPTLVLNCELNKCRVVIREPIQHMTLLISKNRNFADCCVQINETYIECKHNTRCSISTNDGIECEYELEKNDTLTSVFDKFKSSCLNNSACGFRKSSANITEGLHGIVLDDKMDDCVEVFLIIVVTVIIVCSVLPIVFILYRKKTHSNQTALEEMPNLKETKTPTAIMLLYANDCKEFLFVMTTLRSALESSLEPTSKILDIQNDKNLNKEGAGYLFKLLSEANEVILVESDAYQILLNTTKETSYSEKNLLNSTLQNYFRSSYHMESSSSFLRLRLNGFSPPANEKCKALDEYKTIKTKRSFNVDQYFTLPQQLDDLLKRLRIEMPDSDKMDLGKKLAAAITTLAHFKLANSKYILRLIPNCSS